MEHLVAAGERRSLRVQRNLYRVMLACLVGDSRRFNSSAPCLLRRSLKHQVSMRSFPRLQSTLPTLKRAYGVLVSSKSI